MAKKNKADTTANKSSKTLSGTDYQNSDDVAKQFDVSTDKSAELINAKNKKKS